MRALAPLRASLLAHPVYQKVGDVVSLRRFMEHHVWAVWDFMSVLKAVQRRFTCAALPWVPRGSPALRRLVNEIVLLEECDQVSVGVQSHFELYRMAMQEVGADTGAIDRAIAALREGAGLDEALDGCSGPPAALAFTRHTLSVARDGSDAALVGVFTYSREDLIPDLFRSVVAGLAREGADTSLCLEYLERHIAVDDLEHGPLARKMVESICGEDPERWREVANAAREALEARVKLWAGALGSAALERAEPVTG